MTLAERKSRLLRARKLTSKEAPETAAAIDGLLSAYPDRLHTITFDNGKEFAGYIEIASSLGVDVYFANPYHSWERGLNENTNGLLRQYFPKGSDFTKVTDAEVQESVEKINHRPRKCLDFKSPHEVFFGTVLSYTKRVAKVALRM